MLFNSFSFLLFFLLTFLIYYLPLFRRFQVVILVIASFIFYSWENPLLVTLLVISILINGFTSFRIAQAFNKKNRLFWALTGSALNLTILSLFKYGYLITHLFIDNFSSVNPEEGLIALIVHLPLPIGISFYTFEGISLVLDVFRQEDKETYNRENNYVGYSLIKHIFNTSFFIAFFPHLIAGPILKANNFYPQIGIKNFKDIPWNIVFRSLVVGYFLKMVLADNLKEYTYWISFPFFQGLGTVTNVVLLFGYSMQIFADFAGYSLIAIGLAAALGYSLPDNFNFPYISRSIAEFWRRWHISLSTWLRDYLYFPLGGNRKGNFRTYVNLMIVMTLGGLWHGAAWSYAVWGIFHGIGLALERFLGLAKDMKAQNEQLNALWKQFLLDAIRVILVFSFVSIGWLFFKLPRFEESLNFILTLVQNWNKKADIRFIVPALILSFPVVIYHIPYFPTVQKITNNLKISNSKFIKFLQDAALATMLAFILLNSGSSNAFIYFQF